METWKRMSALGNKYEVSSYGRIKTISFMQRYEHGRTGKEMFRRTKEKILAQQLQNGGYAVVHLWHEGKRYMRTVHRLVAELFITNSDNLSEVNHIDGDKRNNHAYNLEYVTPRNNKLHAVNIGLNRGAIRVVDPTSGVRYPSIAQAAKAAKKSHRTVRSTFERVL